MLRLLNRSNVPPKPKGGWRYADGSLAPAMAHWAVVVPSTDTLVEHGDFEGLVQKVQENLLANHQPIPYPLESWVEELICKNLDPSYRGCTWEDGTEKRTTVGWKEAANFVDKIAWVMERDHRTCVSEEEAKRRLAICEKCPALVAITGCVGCRAVSAEAVKRWGASNVGMDQGAKGCGRCACYITKIHIPLDVLQSAHFGATFPEHCWENDGLPV